MKKRPIEKEPKDFEAIEARKLYKKEVQFIARHPETISFPKQVLKDTEALSSTITPQELASRRDFRGIATSTIDPDTAKDFDDALSVHYLENGYCEVGIHIADVGHYVKEGTALDKEAFKRGTSIYITQTVIPMLPEKISNDLCSLREKEDRLTMSVVVTFNKKNDIKDVWYGKGIINSDKRFTYSEAHEIIASQKGLLLKELNTLNTIAQELLRRRIENGSLLLEDAELEFTYNTAGLPIGVKRKERFETHHLVEEFMLLANTEIAKLFKKDIAVYRIHGKPDEEKLKELYKRAQEYMYALPKKIDTRVLNTFLANITDDDTKILFSKLITKAMAKAIYSSKNIGHYGLGFKEYTHFTSPIRRYPDLLVHRALVKKIEKQTESLDPKDFEASLEYLSNCERHAQDVERASQKDMQTLYMQQHIGETRIGFVSGIQEYGIYIQDKESLCEGFIHRKSMGNNWRYNDKKAFWKSKDDIKIRMGDHIEFTVESINFEKGFIDYSFNKKI